MIFYKAKDVLWNPVGLDGEESLLIKEGDETLLFIIIGQMGSAIWSRIDGNRSLQDIEQEMVQKIQIEAIEASTLLEDFLNELAENQLITSTPPQNPLPTPSCPLVPWPEKVITPSLKPFDMEPFVSSDLIALGSFVGGTNNAQSPATCWGGTEGGINDVGGGFLCGPGDSYGFANAGWFFTPCGG
jgi:hypothetical protein